jgi:membrane protein YqaA with SNARE-associated domain
MLIRAIAQTILFALSVLKAIPLPMPSSIVIPPWITWKHAWPMLKWEIYKI